MTLVGLRCQPTSHGIDLFQLYRGANLVADPMRIVNVFEKYATVWSRLKYLK